MKRYIHFFFFFLVMGIYLWVPFSMIEEQQSILTKGKLFRFQLKTIEPNDAFQGKHILLNLPQNHVVQQGVSTIFKAKQEAYVTIEKDSLGYAFFKNIYADKPGDPYIKTTVYYVINDSTISFNIPTNMQHYHLDENVDSQKDKVRWDLNKNGKSSSNTGLIHLDVRVLKGDVAIEELYLKNKPFLKYLKSLDL